MTCYVERWSCSEFDFCTEGGISLAYTATNLLCKESVTLATVTEQNFENRKSYMLLELPMTLSSSKASFILPSKRMPKERNRNCFNESSEAVMSFQRIYHRVAPCHSLIVTRVPLRGTTEIAPLRAALHASVHFSTKSIRQMHLDSYARHQRVASSAKPRCGASADVPPYLYTLLCGERRFHCALSRLPKRAPATKCRDLTARWPVVGGAGSIYISFSWGRPREAVHPVSSKQLKHNDELYPLGPSAADL